MKKEAVHMLKDYFVDNSILFLEKVSGWREAVDKVTEPLLAAGTITTNYVDAIKDSISAPGGTYIDLGGQVALAHARPESGVNQTSLSVLHVKESFLLADSSEHPITTMFCLAAQDSNAHIELMQSLAGLLTDADKLQALHSAESVEDLKKSLF
jgi:ascorbate PTS system EIIA or EIIAB component